MSEDSHVTLTIGTHTWVPNDVEKIQGIVSIMRARNIKNLDSARLYVSPPSNTICNITFSYLQLLSIEKQNR